MSVSVSVERDLIFISKATPGDDQFVLWLAPRLEAAGYKVFADIFDLDAGDEWRGKLTAALQTRAIKMLLCCSDETLARRGVREEIAIAEDLTKQLLDPNFIIPLKIRTFQKLFGIGGLQYIDFENGWAKGLATLLKSLERQQVPRAGGGIIQPEWYAQAFDDGGISGGTMQRPALQRLLKAVEDRTVDVIVVYKVDRLTRSLADFARMVELFDKHGVSFVSVTQQFNTTTSMGRLTLNVLLSFAQFEREVTSERIRDKVKASKAKGMWMGGNVPFGYRVEDRKLIVDPADADTLRTIFQQYVEVGTITRLIACLKELDIRRLDRDGKLADFTRGGLQTLLANPIYIGKIRHGKVLHDGQHEAIVDMVLWNAVHEQFRINSQGPKWRERVTEPLPLLGKLFDAEMRRFVGSHTIKKARRYRFYISESLRREADPTGWRLPAAILEDKVGELIRLVLKDGVAITSAAYGAGIDPTYIKGMIAHAADAASKWSLDKMVKDVIARVQIQADQICLELKLDALLPKAARTDSVAITVRRQFPVVLKRRGIEMRLVMKPTDYGTPRIDQQLVTTVAKGHVWFEDWLSGKITGYKDIVEREGISASYAGDVMKLAFLSPTLVEDIIQGRQPDGLMVSHLTKVEDMPLRWEDQAAQYGWT